jgi:hypothetical protein
MKAQDSLHVYQNTNGTSGTIANTSQRIFPTEKSSEKRHIGFFKEIINSFNDIDTNYIEPQRYDMTVMLQETNDFESYKLNGSTADQSLTFSPVPSYKIGPYFGYKWLFFGWGFDPGNINNGKKTNKTVFELSLYTSLIGCDVIYRRTGEDFRIKKAKGFGDADNLVIGRKFSGMEVNLTGINLYYIFNHRRFSYPAAFSQSTIQKRSQGTWKVGLAYTKHDITYNYLELPDEILNNTQHPLAEDMKFNKTQYQDIGVSIGYAYNWVFARNWLFCSSFSPSIGYKRTKGDFGTKDMNTKERLRYFFSLNSFNLDYTIRTGLVWNDMHTYGGVSLVIHSYNYWQNTFSSSNTFGTINVYFGLNFKKRRS